MIRNTVKNKSNMIKLKKELADIRRNNRKFLTFSTIDLPKYKSKPKPKTNLNFPNDHGTITVYTDYSGRFAYLAKIKLEDFAKVIETHFEIVKSKSKEQEKLKKLVRLWRPINDKISGYLFGDLSEDSLKNWKP